MEVKITEAPGYSLSVTASLTTSELPVLIGMLSGANAEIESRPAKALTGTLRAKPATVSDFVPTSSPPSPGDSR